MSRQSNDGPIETESAFPTMTCLTTVDMIPMSAINASKYALLVAIIYRN